ncbi:MAG: hypothetical protein NTZ24_13850 [Deltaproteobacteria bacterium]|nr:hypothetical protein [Deltaproteobacteria bacterium]
MSEWKKFKVGMPASKGFNSSCMPFDAVSHTSHVGSAINIIEAGEISPSLVFDESQLNDQRILVSWLSPNHWSNGFRYGNIRFHFSFKDIIEGKKYYWVEAIAYRIKACRILITDIDRDSQLDAYDPMSPTGPWWLNSSDGYHYFNNNYCLEFMIEAPVPLSNLKRIDFVDHHSSYCSIHRKNPSRCNELGVHSSKGGAIFLTRAAVSGVDLSKFSEHFIREDGRPRTELESAFNEFVVRVSRKVKFSGSFTGESETSIAVVRAVMSAFTFGLMEEAKLLCEMFKDETTFTNAAAIVLSEMVGLEKWEELAST